MLDFKKQVIERSHTIPVLVDFWAPWCGPCRVLGPVLEQLAEEQKDRWELIKINTEEDQELAQEYQVMSIPNVKLFHRGEIIEEFKGAMPKFQVEQWLNTHLPDPSAEELQGILAEVGTKAGLDKLRTFAATHPNNTPAKLALAQRLVFQESNEAFELVEGILLGDPLYNDAEDVRTLIRMMQFETENGSQVGAHLLAARKALQQDDPEIAIQKIIEATMVDKNYRDDLPRKAAIALFHLWGNEHELTRGYRRRFDMVLY